ncbi:MAG TPA: hypothetical protein PKW80_00680 [Bacteroidales bacterium]|nr:hypothetical protein [Bacteroidales bacterium]
MLRKILGSSGTHVFICFLLLFGMIFISCRNKPGNTIEAALLKHDWQTVYDDCFKNDSLLKKPETAALMGHAAIMLNKNNEAFFLLRSINNDSVARKEWQKWTEDFGKRFSEEAIAIYLKGDAYARNGQHENALECFNDAITMEKDFALPFNARGLIYELIGDTGHALQDFNRACKLNPQIAEFYISRGTLFYNTKGPETAFVNFDTAFMNSPGSAIALNGKACSMFFYFNRDTNNTNDLDSIMKYFSSASAISNIPLINENIRTMIMMLENKISPSLIKSPLFRFSDFIDWYALRQRSINDTNDIFRFLLKSELPEMLDVEIISKLNDILKKEDLFSEIKNIIIIIPELQIREIKNKSILSGKTDFERSQIFNRILLERVYYGLILPYENRVPGTQLTWDRGLMDPQKYRDGLSTSQIKQGEARMDYLYRPGADIVEQIPYIGPVLSGLWNRHLDNATKHNEIALEKRGIDYTPGGALADVRRIYNDSIKGPYPLKCLNGVGYDSK